MNVMSVDVEDWFSVEDMRGIIPRQDWERLESRVVATKWPATATRTTCSRA